MEVERFKTTMSLAELEMASLIRLLSIGIGAIGGGDRLSDWLTDHYDQLIGGFGHYDSVYLLFDKDTKEISKELITLLEEEQIGDRWRWVYTKDGKWLLQITWH